MSWQRGWGEMTPGTDARPVNRGRMVTLSRGELDDMVEAIERRHDRAVKWVGALAVALGLICGVGVSRALGETVQIGRHFVNGVPAIPSSVTISPSAVPGELAIVTFDNRHVNERADNGSREIATADVAVSVRFTFDYNSYTGADRIDVTAPAGVACEPADCGVTVMEGFTGTVTLFDWRGM